MGVFSKFCAWLFSFIQNHRLDLYILAYFGFLIFLLTRISGLELVLPLLASRFQGFTPFEAAVLLMIVFAALQSLRALSNLAAIISLSVVGFGIGFLYLANAAPDVALVQFLVESLTIILVVLCFQHLPKAPFRALTRSQKFINFCISLTIGSLVGVLTFLTSSILHPQTLTRYFSENSVKLAHGRNVVNSILVNFRSLDTLLVLIFLSLATLGTMNLAKRGKELRP